MICHLSIIIWISNQGEHIQNLVLETTKVKDSLLEMQYKKISLNVVVSAEHLTMNKLENHKGQQVCGVVSKHVSISE